MSNNASARHFACLLPIACLLVVACRNSSVAPQKARYFPADIWQKGDLAWRRGTGLRGLAVLTADSKSIYTHVDILTRHQQTWCVIHAMPEDEQSTHHNGCVRIDSLETFFSPQNASCGAVMRVQTDSLRRAQVALEALKMQLAHLPFDNSFNLNDSSRMYCTEMVTRLYARAGVDLTEGRISQLQLPGFRDHYILPTDITRSSKLTTIYRF